MTASIYIWPQVHNRSRRVAVLQTHEICNRMLDWSIWEQPYCMHKGWAWPESVKYKYDSGVQTHTAFRLIGYYDRMSLGKLFMFIWCARLHNRRWVGDETLQPSETILTAHTSSRSKYGYILCDVHLCDFNFCKAKNFPEHTSWIKASPSGEPPAATIKSFHRSI